MECQSFTPPLGSCRESNCMRYEQELSPASTCSAWWLSYEKRCKTEEHLEFREGVGLVVPSSGLSETRTGTRNSPMRRGCSIHPPADTRQKMQGCEKMETSPGLRLQVKSAFTHLTLSGSPEQQVCSHVGWKAIDGWRRQLSLSTWVNDKIGKVIPLYHDHEQEEEKVGFICGWFHSRGNKGSNM